MPNAYVFGAREYGNMVLCLGEACGNASLALRMYKERFPKVRHPADSRSITAAYQRIIENRPIAPFDGLLTVEQDEASSPTLIVEKENSKTETKPKSGRRPSNDGGIETWSKEKVSCPNCKTEIEIDDKQHKINEMIVHVYNFFKWECEKYTKEQLLERTSLCTGASEDEVQAAVEAQLSHSTEKVNRQDAPENPPHKRRRVRQRKVSTPPPPPEELADIDTLVVKIEPDASSDVNPLLFDAPPETKIEVTETSVQGYTNEQPQILPIEIETVQVKIEAPEDENTVPTEEIPLPGQPRIVGTSINSSSDQEPSAKRSSQSLQNAPVHKDNEEVKPDLLALQPSSNNLTPTSTVDIKTEVIDDSDSDSDSI